MTNILKSFQQLKDSMYLTYRGYRGERVFEKNGERIYYQNKNYTVSEFKEHIDNYINEQATGIGNSIRKSPDTKAGDSHE